MKHKENILKYADKILAYTESRLYIEQNDYDTNDYFGLQRSEFMNIVCYLIDNNLIVATDEYNHYITNNGRLVLYNGGIKKYLQQQRARKIKEFISQYLPLIVSIANFCLLLLQYKR